MHQFVSLDEIFLVPGILSCGLLQVSIPQALSETGFYFYANSNCIS